MSRPMNALPLLAVLGFFVMTSCNHCNNSVIREVASPSGHLKAVIFQRDCGATTDFSTQLSIIDEANSIADGPGNALTADTDHGSAPSIDGGGPEVRVRWTDDSHLRVGVQRRTRLILNETSVHGVTIEYERFE
jgi:hypothetical protein